MEHYKNLSGRSGVASYEISPGSIRVRFKDGHVYLYTIASAGSRNIEHMKSLGSAGMGLNGFINTTVKKSYISKS